MNSQPLDPWIEGYLEYLKTVRRLGRLTLATMRCSLKQVCTDMSVIRPSVALWLLSLPDYMQWINKAREEGYSTTTISRTISHLRGLLDYAWRSGRCTCNVLDGFSLQDSLRPVEPRALTVEEARTLILACGRRGRLDRRNRLVVLMLYGCGLRTQELCQLDVGDVDLERQEIMVRHGKGDRQRRIPVPDALWTEILAWLAERRGKRGALFLTESKRRRISSKDVCDIMRQATAAAGLDPGITAKTLRHTFATHLMDRGVDLAVISSLMGHRSPQETGVYLHVLPGRLQNAVARLNHPQTK